MIQDGKYLLSIFNHQGSNPNRRLSILNHRTFHFESSTFHFESSGFPF